MVLFDIFRVTVLAANLMSNLAKSVGRGPDIFSQLQDGSEKVFIKIHRLTESEIANGHYFCISQSHRDRDQFILGCCEL